MFTKYSIAPKTIVTFILFAIISAFAAVAASGQAAQYTNNTKDQSLRGSGGVNASTLAMEFSVPLAGYPGRGIGVPIGLNYSSKVWRLAYSTTAPHVNNGCYSVVNPKFSEYSASGWNSTLDRPFIEYTGSLLAYLNDGSVYYDDTDIACDPGNTNNPTKYYIRRVTLRLPGGETHELRKSDTSVTLSATWDGTFYAVDGSNIVYVEDSATDLYRVKMTDGSFYDLASSASTYRYATRLTDRNGNYLEYNAGNSTYPNGFWTDTMGRSIPIPIAPSAPASVGTTEYEIAGLDGDPITYRLYWRQLKGSSESESALTTFGDTLLYQGDKYWDGSAWQTRTEGFMFSSEWDEWIIAENTQFNPIVLYAIELPTGEKYRFTYNVRGEIDRVYYPTGGEERFEYSAVSPVTESLGVYGQANRGVTTRKIYETAAGTPSEWVYGVSASGAAYVITTTAPDDTVNVRYLHRGNIDALWGFESPIAGMPYREFNFTSAGVLQTQKFTYWSESTNGRHPRVAREENITYDPNGSGVSATAIYEYEGDLSYKETPVLAKKTTLFAFETASGGNSITPTNLPAATPPSLPTTTPPTELKSSESTFLINDTSYSSTARDAYKAQNMVGLVTATVLKDGSGTTVAKSETVFDDATNYPLISAASSETNWTDPNTNYRGNPNTSKVWDSTKGAVTSSAAYISSHAQFDNFGNARKSWNALGTLTETTYSASNGLHFALPTAVSGAAPDPNGTYGSNTGFSTSITYDAVTGLPLTATDINGAVTSTAYDSATLRPTSITAPNGHVTEFEYGEPDANGVYSSSERFVKTRAQIDASNWKEGYTWLDGLGRSNKGQSVESDGDIYAETEFDIMGRVKRSTNPYKTGETKLWTTPTYDDWGRVTVVTAPDSTTVQMSYGISTSGIVGITKTVTDQAGRKRKGISNALGQMVRVIEDPDGQNLSTDYVFDTLGNLRKTTQGDQTRYFMHDSLGRLLYAKQVEQEANTAFSGSGYTDPVTSNNQWSVKYVYDDAGNITSTTDARNKSITATYDNLNRLVVRNYSDTSMPDVSFYYDGKGLGSVPANSKGKLTKVTSSVSETRYTGFDNMGRLTSHQQITDGETYSTAYTYSLSGALIEETYPSGRVIKHTVNGDGELSMVQSKKNSNFGYYAYAFGMEYDKNGALTKLRLGNGRWETYSYNNRQQVTEIGLGTTDSLKDVLKLEFGYGVWESGTLNTNKNNGSMAQQKITVPTVGGTSGFTADQRYLYDGLNRLESATETISGTETWKQKFAYDRYGNRSIDAANTTAPANCTSAICNPAFSTSTNRISSSGYTYDADGNLTQNAAGERFGYDQENRQMEFFVNGNNGPTPDATYSYDGEGRRVKKISSTETTVFVYDGAGRLVAEYSAALAQTQQVSYLTTDHLGSPRLITNEVGAVTKRQDFGAFGDETLTAARASALGYTTTDELRQDYTGYQKDNESGLEYAQARYYNTAHGRFTSVDPLTASATVRDPQSFNRYSYVLNSPYKFTDPLGLAAQTSGSFCAQWCQNSGPQMDGSSIRGRDATFDWTNIEKNEDSAGPCKKSDCSNTSAHRVERRATGSSAPAVAGPVRASAQTGPKAKGTPGNVRFVPTYVFEVMNGQYFGFRPGFYLTSGDQILTYEDLPDLSWTSGGVISGIAVDGINLLSQTAYTFTEAEQDFASSSGTTVPVEIGEEYVFSKRSDVIVFNGSLVNPANRTIVSTVLKINGLPSPTLTLIVVDDLFPQIKSLPVPDFKVRPSFKPNLFPKSN